MLNVPRFQLALNSENPDIVKIGLRQFLQQIITENNVSDSFGTNGVSYKSSMRIDQVLHPTPPSKATGLLRDYLDASPQIEEFFILWDLPGREYDAELCVDHMNCLVAILFCAATDVQFSRYLTQRIATSYSKSIIKQFDMKEQPLTFATLGLLIVMYRINKIIPEDIFSYLLTEGLTGKTMLLHAEGALPDQLEARSALVVLTFLILNNSSDPNSVLKVILDEKAFKSLFRDMLQATDATIELTLRATQELLLKNKLIKEYVHKFLSRLMLGKLTELSLSKHETKASLACGVLQAIAAFIVDNVQVSAGNQKRHLNNCINDLLDSLKADVDEVHREIQLQLLNAQPQFLKKAIQSLKLASWEPDVIMQYSGLLHHLMYLLDSVSVDKAISENVSHLLQSSGSLVKTQFESCVSSWLPNGLSKKEINKMISHQNQSVQLLGMELTVALLKRVQRQFDLLFSQSHPVAEQVCAEVLDEVLPDFHTLYNARSKFLDRIKGLRQEVHPMGNVDDSKDNTVEDDMDLEMNFGEVDDVLTSLSAKTINMPHTQNNDHNDDEHRQAMKELVNKGLSLYFQSLQIWCELAPVLVCRLKCDMLKFVDELLPCKNDDIQEIVTECKLIDDNVVETLVGLLSFMTRRHLCQWFGNEDDAHKLLNLLIMNEDWKKSVKKSPLSKILLLAQSHSSSTMTKHTNAFIYQLLLSSGLFHSNQHMLDIELHSEAHLWIRSCLSSDVLVLDTLLKLCFHWNASIYQFANQIIVDCPSYLSSEVELRPITPLIILAICLSSGHFQPFEQFMPKYIQAYMVGLRSDFSESEGKTKEQSKAFFEKFRGGFRVEIENVLMQLLCNMTAVAQYPRKYIEIMLAVMAKFPVYLEGCQLNNYTDVLLSSSLSKKKGNKKGKKEKKDKKEESISSEESLLHMDTYPSYVSKLTLAVTQLEDLLDDNQEWSSFLQSNAFVICYTVLKNNSLKTIHSSAFEWMEKMWRSWNIEANKGDSYPFCITFGLQMLQLLNSMLNSEVKEYKDLEKKKCAALLSLADYVGEAVLHLVSALQQNPYIISILQSVEIISQLYAENAYGMICRRVVSECLSLRAFLTLHKTEKQTIIDSFVQHMSHQLPGQSVYTDRSYLVLMNKLAKISNNAALLQIYCNMRLSDLSSNNSQQVDVANAQLMCSYEDPVMEILLYSLPNVTSDVVSRIIQHSSNSNYVNPVPFHSFLSTDQEDKAIFFDPLAILNKEDNGQAMLLNLSPVVSTLLSYHTIFDVADIAAITQRCNQVQLEDFENKTLKQLESALKLKLNHLLSVESSEHPNQHWFGYLKSLLDNVNLYMFNIVQRVSFLKAIVLELNATETSAIFIGQLLCYPFLVLSLDNSNKDTKETSVEQTKICQHFCELLQLYCDSWKKDAPRREFDLLSERIVQLLSVHHIINKNNSNEEMIKKAQEEVGKWIKRVLWNKLESKSAMSSIFHIAEILLASLTTGKKGIFGIESIEHSLHPLKLLRLVVNHERLPDILVPEDATSSEQLDPSAALEESNETERKLENGENSREILLVMVLKLWKGLQSCKLDKTTLLPTAQRMWKVFAPFYTGHMGVKDRFLFRLLHILYADMQVGCPLYKLQPHCNNVGSNKADHWIFDFIKASSVYMTLSNFPIWRSVLSQSFLFEENRYISRDSYHSALLEFKGKFSNQMLADQLHVTKPFEDLDLLRDMDGSVYDPGYVIPLLLYVLKKQSLSIRSLANCGALSLLFMGLAAECSVLRSYSLAALTLVLKYIHEQDAERDPNFKERPQLMSLLNFLKNAIDPVQKKEKEGDKISPIVVDESSAIRLPATTATFFAKAALHLLQPKHELYIPTNQYLIGRPFCDFRDLPLYDSLVLNVDAETEQSERLSVLRALRDSLHTRQDHLNLCRKNAYSKLMLLIPQIGRDPRSGHAIFDILESALSHRESARYLIERCSLISWLTEQSNMPEAVISAEFPAFSGRALLLLRKVVNILFLLDCDSITAGQIEIGRSVDVLIQQVQDADFARSSANLQVLNVLILLLWDVAFFSSSKTSRSSAALGNMLTTFVPRLHKYFLQQSNGVKKLHLSLLLLLSFVDSTSGISCDDLISMSNYLLSHNLPGNKVYLSPTEINIDDHGKINFYRSMSQLFEISLKTVQSMAYPDRIDQMWLLLKEMEFKVTDALPDSLGRNFVQYFVFKTLAKLTTSYDLYDEMHGDILKQLSAKAMFQTKAMLTSTDQFLVISALKISKLDSCECCYHSHNLYFTADQVGAETIAADLKFSNQQSTVSAVLFHAISVIRNTSGWISQQVRHSIANELMQRFERLGEITVTLLQHHSIAVSSRVALEYLQSVFILNALVRQLELHGTTTQVSVFQRQLEILSNSIEKSNAVVASKSSQTWLHFRSILLAGNSYFAPQDQSAQNVKHVKLVVEEATKTKRKHDEILLNVMDESDASSLPKTPSLKKRRRSSSWKPMSKSLSFML